VVRFDLPSTPANDDRMCGECEAIGCAYVLHNAADQRYHVRSVTSGDWTTSCHRDDDLYVLTKEECP